VRAIYGPRAASVGRPINQNIPRDRALIHVYLFARRGSRAEKRGESELWMPRLEINNKKGSLFLQRPAWRPRHERRSRPASRLVLAMNEARSLNVHDKAAADRTVSHRSDRSRTASGINVAVSEIAGVYTCAQLLARIRYAGLIRLTTSYCRGVLPVLRYSSGCTEYLARSDKAHFAR